MAPLLLLLALGLACSDYKLSGDDDGNAGSGDGGSDGGDGGSSGWDCDPDDYPPGSVGVDDTCPTEPEGGFTPVAEWTDPGGAEGCLSLPIVADIDADGMPEVVFNKTPLLSGIFGNGTLRVLSGDSGALEWEDTAAELAYGSPPAVADLDGDGFGEIVVVREYASALWGEGDYAVALYGHDGTELWESEHFTGDDMDWASAPSISDMDHDGSAEIVVGRVILRADGSTRGVGEYGRGSYGSIESSVSAVVDLDLDGQEEVIVGNAAYDVDGEAIWFDEDQSDAMIGIADLDEDPEGEIIGITGSTIRAMDTDGTVLWGPIEVPTANILATPAIADLDDDGYPEIVTAGGNRLVVFNHDGTELWGASVTDKSGATGASIFDFEGDGIPEVVYIDEREMVAYEGPTGRIKFFSEEHSSNTMFDYPVVADVDMDDQAEILVCHMGYSAALTAYGDADESWIPARPLWNQHAYVMTNIDDDLGVPERPMPGFVATNTWHAGIDLDDLPARRDLQAEVLEVCTDDCDEGTVLVLARATNRGDDPIEVDIDLSLYAEISGDQLLIETRVVPAPLASGWSSEGVLFEVPASALEGADAVWVYSDDDGTGLGVVDECAEDNNGYRFESGFCP